MTHFTLHIGLHKTGTSTIQSFLSDNRDRLLEQGIDFPLTGRTPGGTQAHRHVAAWFRNQKLEYPPEFVQVMRNGLSKSPRCIISSEDLYSCHPVNIDKIAVAFAPDTQILCYLRNPGDHIVSMYKERLKGKDDVPFGNFLRFYQNALETDSPKSYYSYERNLGYWGNFFRVTAAPYRRSGLIEDFMDRCGIDLPGAVASEEPRNNVSLSDNAMMFQVALRRALNAGLVSKEEWRRIKHCVVASDEDRSLPPAGDHFRMLDFDFRPFLALFRAANPGLAYLADQSPERVAFWDTESLVHVAVLELLRDFYPSTRQARRKSA